MLDYVSLKNANAKDYLWNGMAVLTLHLTSVLWCKKVGLGQSLAASEAIVL